MTETKDRKSPRVPVLSKQYDLFSGFLGDARELSNTIELWDAIPKYSVSARRQNKMRSTNNRLPVYEYDFSYRQDNRCRVVIQPASIKMDDGYVDYYPSADEELIEEVIKKIFTDQQYGLHDVEQTESWVKFSLQMIRKELKAREKTRSLDEIKRSLEILSNSIIRLYVGDDPDPVYTNAILSDVTRVTREKYLEDGTQLWWARLPALVSKSINELSYRQFNYGVLMSMSSQLARWLHKRMSHNYINASFMQPYGILFTTIQRDSGLLTQPRTNDNIKTLDKALSELRDQNVISKWDKQERRDGRTIMDVKYTLHAHSDFIRDIKAANARSRDASSALAGTAVHKLDQGGR